MAPRPGWTLRLGAILHRLALLQSRNPLVIHPGVDPEPACLSDQSKIAQILKSVDAARRRRLHFSRDHRVNIDGLLENGELVLAGNGLGFADQAGASECCGPTKRGGDRNRNHSLHGGESFLSVGRSDTADPPLPKAIHNAGGRDLGHMGGPFMVYMTGFGERQRGVENSSGQCVVWPSGDVELPAPALSR